jgi:hypothetical protein
MSHRIRNLVLVVAALAALGAALAASAFGVSPKPDTYYCSSGYQLKIKPRHHYKFSVGDAGKYRYKSASHKLIFKTGYLHKDWYGVFRRDDNTGKWAIIDLELKDHSGSDFCER